MQKNTIMMLPDKLNVYGKVTILRNNNKDQKYHLILFIDKAKISARLVCERY